MLFRLIEKRFFIYWIFRYVIAATNAISDSMIRFLAIEITLETVLVLQLIYKAQGDQSWAVLVGNKNANRREHTPPRKEKNELKKRRALLQFSCAIYTPTIYNR